MYILCVVTTGGNLCHRLWLEKRLKKIMNLHTGNMVMLMDQKFPLFRMYNLSGINTFIINP